MIATINSLTESKEAINLFNLHWYRFVFLVDIEEYFMFNALQCYFNIFISIKYVNFHVLNFKFFFEVTFLLNGPSEM
jgi:hypothetical protein